MLVQRAMRSGVSVAGQSDQQVNRSRLGSSHARRDLSRTLDRAANRVVFVVRHGARRTQQRLVVQAPFVEQIGRHTRPRRDGRQQVRGRHALLAIHGGLLGQLAEGDQLGLDSGGHGDTWGAPLFFQFPIKSAKFWAL